MTGRWVLAARLVRVDLRRRSWAGVLTVLALVAATTTMTLALVVRGPASAAWDRTFAATNGPHAVVASYDAPVAAVDGPEVVARAGPFPLLSFDGFEVMGRDREPSTVDRPAVMAGSWIRDGGVVVEESWAAARGLAPGDRMTIAGRDFDVVGVAVTAFRQPTPFYTEGLFWATRVDAAALAPAAASRGEVLMLRLADPATAAAFAEAHGADDWRSTRYDALTDVLFAQFGLIVGAVALALLAAASVAVAVTGRVAAQARRAAVLRAVGATPRYVALVVLAEHLLLAAVAAAAGIVAGGALAPVLGGPARGILPTPGVVLPSAGAAGLVLGASLLLVAVSTVVPARRAARASTVRALAAPVRAPRRSRLALAVSRRLPVPLLLGVRLTARRPGRAFLAAAGLAVTVAAVVVALWMRAGIAGDVGDHAVYDKLEAVTYAFIVALVVLALANAVLVAGTTALDNARTAALVRALGATPRQVATGLTVAAVLPALVAVVAGIPLGFAVFSTAAAAAGDGSGGPTPGTVALVAVVPATLVAVAALTAIPSRAAARRPVVQALDSD